MEVQQPYTKKEIVKLPMVQHALVSLVMLMLQNRVGNVIAGINSKHYIDNLNS